jgi:hypothetical protein
MKGFLLLPKCLLNHFVKQYLNDFTAFNLCLTSLQLNVKLKSEMKRRKLLLRREQYSLFGETLFRYTTFDTKLFYIKNGRRIFVKENEVSLLKNVSIRLDYVPNLSHVINEIPDIYDTVKNCAKYVNFAKVIDCDHFSFANVFKYCEELKLIVWYPFHKINMLAFATMSKLKSLVIIDYSIDYSRNVSLRIENLKKFKYVLPDCRVSVYHRNKQTDQLEKCKDFFGHNQ